jgi:nitrate reductase NapAB chaperone NapD
MSIKSYLVYPRPGLKLELITQLSNLRGCEIIPAENRDVVILVTETPDQLEENELEQRILSLPAVESLNLVCGFEDSGE